MNINQLKYFITIAEEQSFSAAAKKLYVTQPSLSQSILNIEKQIGTPLFDRTQNPIEMTPAGEVFLIWAKQVTEMQIETERKIQDLIENSHTALRIGASQERTRTLVVPAINRFRKKRPNCKVIIYEVTASELHEMLNDDEIDIAIGKYEEDQYEYKSIKLSNEYPVLAIPKSIIRDYGLALSEQDEIDLKAIKDIPFISLSMEQTYGNYFMEYCSRSGFIPNIVVECRTIPILHDLIKQGLGAGLVTNAAVKTGADYNSVNYYNLLNLPAERNIYAVYKNKPYYSDDLTALISIMKTIHAE